MPIDKLPYWDSDVFISRIQKTLGRIEDLRAITDAAERGDVTIVTSFLTEVEVVKLKELGLLDEETERMVAQFFENDYLSVRVVDRFVAEKARPIVRQFKLKPTDAVHVATALLMEVDVLHTYDERHLLPLNGQIDKLDGGSKLRIEKPRS
ncbi:MAG TPA: type II toxin-antitoxin system VapC family toxin [Bryobacteraceae bacterium]|nr:type II toxin-antitoxin system VapC family toxin [Bryobacteraceae bacterium]